MQVSAVGVMLCQVNFSGFTLFLDVEAKIIICIGDVLHRFAL